MTAKDPKVSQTIFDNAVKGGTATELIAHLRSLPTSQSVIDQVSGLVRRTEALVIVRPNPPAQARRNALLVDVRTHLQASVPSAELEAYDAAVRLIRLAEDGYHRILAFLARCPFATEPADARASAVVARMEANLAALRADIETTLKATSTLSMPGGVGHRDAEGQFVSSDSAVASMVGSLGGTLLMQGYADRWFDRQHGWLVLPDLPTVNQEKILLAGQSEVLSMSWLRWERLHQTARYGDTDVHALAGPDLPDGCPESIALVYARDASRDTLDFIANQRTIDREAIATVDLSGSTSISRIGKGIAGTVAEAPAEYVSSEEVMNILALSEAVGYEIVKDQDRPGGLRLVQWIRGYMCLSELTSSRSASGAADLPRVSRADLVDLLRRASLTNAEAKVFLDAVSFGRGRRDLFDAPVVRTKGDWLLIGPALAAPRMAKIVPSLLASMDIQLKRKGSAFEARVLTLLKNKGIDARYVKVSRGGATYEYDVLASWNDHIFHFECKNRRLSGNDPIQAYRFHQEILSGIKQVHRLRDGLTTWPEIVTEEFGATAAGKTLVHCLLQNDTYCIPGGVEGVYVYDWSALSRFFEAGWLRAVHDHRLPGNVVARNWVGVKRIWRGAEPTPEDLIAEMEAPSQFAIVNHHLDLRQSIFQLDEASLAVDWFLERVPSTLTSFAEALGVPGEAITRRMAEVDAQIAEARMRAEGKREG